MSDEIAQTLKREIGRFLKIPSAVRPREHFPKGGDILTAGVKLIFHGIIKDVL